jgi:hypothetical protein
MRGPLVSFAVAFVAAAALATAVAGPARADGDPASDYLVAQDVFFPFYALDEQVPVRLHDQLEALCAEAKRAGFPIRVAIISKRYDLGAIPSLWQKPQEYSRFLGLEIRFAYKQRLLVVMPSGFGYTWPGHDTASGQRLLDKIEIDASTEGLIRAGIDAVSRLAAAEGVTLSGATSGSARGGSKDHMPLIAAAAVAVVVVLTVARFLLVRRQRRRPL